MRAMVWSLSRLGILLASFLCSSRFSTLANAACDIVPSAKMNFRGQLGSVDRPFARPNDWVELSLDSKCDRPSPGFRTGIDGQVVTLLFAPSADGPRNAVVLASRCAALGPELQSCQQTSGIASVTCLDVNQRGRLLGLKPIDMRTLRFRFPSSDLFLPPENDGLGFTGPVTIAVTARGAPLPCGLAAASCSAFPDLLACVGELFAENGTCGDQPGETFSHFIGLPSSNLFQSLCTSPLSVCQPAQDRRVRAALDDRGNLLVPMDWRGVVSDADALPVARLLRGSTSAAPFPGRPGPIVIPSATALSSFSPEGARIDPTFDPQADPTELGQAAFFGTADAFETVLRVASRSAETGQCDSGPKAGLACIVDADCAGATCAGRTCFVDGASTSTPCTRDSQCSGSICGTPLFDFGTRTESGVGPVLLATSDVEARDPVPLDGFTQSEGANVLVLEEAISLQDANGDGDSRDHVIKLEDRFSGQMFPIGDAGSDGRAIARVRVSRFSFPAVASQDDIVAFLEPEALQGGVDQNGNQRVLETNLRAYRLRDGGIAENLVEETVTADPNPIVSGRSLAISRGLIFYRRAEALEGAQITDLLSASPQGLTGNDLSFAPALSADGRVAAFYSFADNLLANELPPCPNSISCANLYVRDRSTHTTAIASRDGLGRRIAPRLDDSLALSTTGRYIAFTGVHADDRSVPKESCLGSRALGDVTECPGVFVYDRVEREVARVSVNDAGLAANGVSFAPKISADGRWVAFVSHADNLAEATDELCSSFDFPAPHPCASAFLRDRWTSRTIRIPRPLSLAGTLVDGVDVELIGLSQDGLRVLYRVVSAELDDRPSFIFDSRTAVTTSAPSAFGGPFDDTLPTASGDLRFEAVSVFDSFDLPGDTNGIVDSVLFDHSANLAFRVSIASDGRQGEGSGGAVSNPTTALSPSGHYVSFSSVAGNLGVQPTVGQHAFVHDVTTSQTAEVGAAAFGVAVSNGGEVAFGNGSDVLLRGVVPEEADFTGDDDADDEILEVLRASDRRRFALCPAERAAVADGRVAFLRREASGATSPDRLSLCPAGSPREEGPDLNGDEDAADSVVMLWRGDGAVENLDLAAVDVALSSTLVIALVSEHDQDTTDLNHDGDELDLVPAYRSLDGGDWVIVPLAADTIGVSGSTVAFLAVESQQGVDGTDLNDDGDPDDRVLHVIDVTASGARVTNTHRAAEEFVLGPTGLVAFRTSEESQGHVSLNADVDTDDSVLSVYVPAESRVVDTHQSVTPCRFEACDPRTPYRVLDDTVKFLSLEADEGRDVDGDGDLGDLVVQVFNVARACNSGALADACSMLGSTNAGICTNSGQPCASDRNCNGGTCFIPPGGCTLNLGTRCDPNLALSCPSDQFCQLDPDAPPLPDGRPTGSCRRVEGPCASSADCSSTAVCVQADQNFGRLVDPLAERRGGSAIFTSFGRCIERTGDPCGHTADCQEGEFCASGECRRDHGPCVADGDCPLPDVQRCEARLVAATTVDEDEDELPNVVDNCPLVSNIGQEDADLDGTGDACDVQTCGNGRVELGEPCDDGNVMVGDGCDCTVAICPATRAIARSRISISRLGGKAGDERLVFRGRVPLPGSTANTASLADLIASGVQVLIEDGVSGERSIFDLSRRSTSIPGPDTPGCDGGGRDRWIPKPELKGFTYVNRSDELPGAGCRPGSARGLRRIDLIDRRSAGGFIEFVVRVRGVAVPTDVQSLRGTIVLGATPAAATACGVESYQASRCRRGGESGVLLCR